MTFATPYILFFLLLIPLALWGVLARQRLLARRLATLSRHASVRSPRQTLQFSLLACGFAALIVALAGPRWGRSEEEIILRSRTLMLAVDVSRSMLTEDIYPSRLSRAKADLVDLLDVCHGDRVGLLAFRGRANVLCPLTTDSAYLRTTIDALSPQSAPPGETNLADAINRSLAAFENETAAHCAILLITDGEDLDGNALALAKQAGERKIPIFTVGIGSEAGATIPDGRDVVKFEGEPVISRLNPATLQAIASASGGQYIPLATAERARTTLRAVYTRYLSQIADKESRERFEQSMADRSALFFIAAVLFLMGAGATSLGRLGLRRKVAAAVLVALMCAPMTWAQPTPREAQAAYDDGQFAESARLYGAVRPAADPAKIPHYAYNEALAHWHAGDPTAALTALTPAFEDATFALRAHQLAGRLQLELDGQEPDLAKRIERRTAAIQHFTHALQLDPTDETRRNLARALEGLETLRTAHRKALALERYKEKPLPQLLPEMLATQRGLITQAHETFAQDKPRLRLAQFETLSRKVTEQADAWFAVQATLPEMLAQLQDDALRNELLARTEEEQQRLDRAAEHYLLHTADATPLEEGEPVLYAFWKMVADPPGLVDEALSVQMHEVAHKTPLHPDRTNHADVRELVTAFGQRFPEWAQAQEKNEDFTEEDVRMINQATEGTLALLNSPSAPQHGQQILDNLELIKEHLPQQKQQSQNQNQQPPPPQSQEQNPQPQEQPPQEQGTEAEPQETETSDQEKELEALLQRAVDRERDHVEEKQRRLRPRPTARDW